MDWSRETLEKHSLDMRQFIDFRESTLPNGMRVIDAHNSSGLNFTLLPDRGMDIYAASYKGRSLTWLSPGSPHVADFGASWLQQFNGGLLTTCGLTHAGPPEVDDITGEKRDLHGNFTRLCAGQITHNQGYWDPTDGKSYRHHLGAIFNESSLFGTQLQLRRQYSLPLGESALIIYDDVTNIGDTPAPLMLLYHVNVGFPLVAQGTRLITPAEKVIPRDAAAQVGFDTYADYSAASDGYPEQVFFHHLKSPNRKLHVLLANDDWGLEVNWVADTMPYFTQWKNTRRGIYVSGIEPGNCIPEGQNAARKAGRLQMLAPGERTSFVLIFRIHDGADAVQKATQEIETMQQTGTPIAGCRL